MRDSNEFRDEVYRRAARQRKRERHRLSAALGCVVLLLVAGVGLHSLSPLSVKDTADKSHGTTDDILTEEHSVQNIYGSMENTLESIYDITCEESIKYVDFFEIEPSEDTMPSVFIFDNYDEALDFFTQKTGEDETRFRNLGYTNEFFISSDAVFVLHYGYADSGYYVAASNWEKEARIVLHEFRPIDASDMKQLFFTGEILKTNDVPYVLYHYLNFWDELPYGGVPLY